MSSDIMLYCKSIEDSIIPEWIKALNTLGMECEVHPEFTFAKHSGFLPFKILLTENSNALLLNNYYLSGFELYIDDFCIAEHIPAAKPQSWVDKLLKKEPAQQYYHSPAIDVKLANCKKQLQFSWGSADTFELRMACIGAATLSTLINGVCCYTADDSWYATETMLENLLAEITSYEKGLTAQDLKVHSFVSW